MIQRIEGIVIALAGSSVTLMVHGIGLLVAVPRAEMYQIHERILVYTVLTWSAEQGPQLFGFTSEQERDFFELIIGCPGVGPRLGLTMLAQSTVTACAAAIMQNKASVLSGIKGIGMKKAETIIMHMRDKVAAFALYQGTDGSAASEQVLREAAQTLEALKYSPSEVQRALHAVRETATAENEQTFDYIVRRALKYLAKGM